MAVDSSSVGLPDKVRDIAIVGAGPAGLSVAIEAAIDGLDTLFIGAQKEPGGQLKLAGRIEDYPGFAIGVTGKQLARNFYDQAIRSGAEGKLGVRVTTLTYDPLTDGKTLSLSNGERIQARTVVLAGGLEFRKLSFPGFESSSVVYADCEKLAEEGAGKNVVVVGGSNEAASAALWATRTASHVYLISRSPLTTEMRGWQRETQLRVHEKITVLEGDEISSLNLDSQGKAASICTRSGKSIACGALGVFVDGVPSTEWLGPAIKRAASGHIAVKGDFQTSMPGVFAVGDIRQGSTRGSGRIVAAAAEGQRAAMSAFTYVRGVPPPTHD